MIVDIIGRFISVLYVINAILDICIYSLKLSIPFRIQEVVDRIVELLQELIYETEDLYLEEKPKHPEIDR